MSSARVTPLGPYDRCCAFCHDGSPVERRFGKAACEKCRDAFDEAAPVSSLAPLRGLRKAIRDEVGTTGRNYPTELYERALAARKVMA